MQKPVPRNYLYGVNCMDRDMRDVKMRAFGKHLALMGVKKLRTHYGDQYLLNLF